MGILQTKTRLRLVPATNALGVEVHGVSLKDGIDTTLAEDLRELLSRHLVLFFPGQFLDDESQVALARCFGEPEVHPIRLAMNRSEVLTDITDTADTLPDRDGWHTDVSYMRRPPSAAVLRCIDAPPAGGDTLWSNMHLAYESLSPQMQTLCASLSVRYPVVAAFYDHVLRHQGKEIADRTAEIVGQGAVHPLVRTHPVTGRKILYFDRSYAQGIVDLPALESECLTSFISRHQDNPNFQCRWHWHAGDVAVWDERATQHFGAADHRGLARKIRRVTVAGEEPS